MFVVFFPRTFLCFFSQRDDGNRRKAELHHACMHVGTPRTHSLKI